jgi:hypothetical protein
MANVLLNPQINEVKELQNEVRIEKSDTLQKNCVFLHVILNIKVKYIS